MKYSMTRYCLAGLLSIYGAAQADDWQDASGLMAATGYDPNELSFMKDNNLKVGGWLETSVSVNASATHNGFNGPVTFQDRDSQFQLNQLNGFLQKAITVGDKFDWGGRVDVMFGSDSVFTQAYGNPVYNPYTGAAQPRGNWDLHLSGDQMYGLAIPNAYAEFNVPYGNGIDLKVGHFYTPLGYEVVTSPDNFMVTKPYTMQYGEPFTHTGAYGTYSVNGNWSVLAGAVTGSSTGGWDGNFNRNLGTWSWLGGGTWTSDDAGTSLNLTTTLGPQADNNNHLWGIYSLVGKHNFTDKLHFVIQHDHGFAEQVLTANGYYNMMNGKATNALQNAEWYGVNSYLMYDATDKLSAGLRAEWFRDNNGYRVNGAGRCGASVNTTNNGTGGTYNSAGSACNGWMSGGGNYGTPTPGTSYYELTAGLNYKATKWLTLRPNARFDYADHNVFGVGADGVAHNKTQFLFSADAVVVF
jgi:Putative beta-barrel porin-2, OmpL-like. bbp2